MIDFIIIANVSFAGPAVDVGVTMYVLSISSLSEVEMVQKRAEINHDACHAVGDVMLMIIGVVFFLWLYSD